ncbi:MAG: glycosyltransferase family 4 protein [Sulfolobales archaeon]
MSLPHLITITQTPLVRFKVRLEEIVKSGEKPPEIIDLGSLRRGEHYILSPGGVTRMVYPFLKRIVERGGAPWWVSLNPQAPPRIIIDGIRIYHISIPADRIKGYGKAKEAIWGTLHMISESSPDVRDLMWMDEYIDYVYYNRRVAQVIDTLDREEDFDLIYIHDFQHIPLGSMVTSLKPKILRWHIPLEKDLIPDEWMQSMDFYLNKYDAIIVSSKRYSETLRNMGYRGYIAEIYPYIDPNQYGKPSESDIEGFSSRYGLKPDDKVILIVARMDPMKGQDRAIKALKIVKKAVPEAKLVLVGNGSFSSSKNGVGLSKGERWARYLANLATELGVSDSVIMTGYVDQKDLEAAYSRAGLVMLPSIIEGFGLAVIEGWLYKKPAIVSNRAGVSDLIVNGVNGIVIDPNDIEGIASSIIKLLKDEKLSQSVGEKGYETSKKCFIESVIDEELRLIEYIVGGK